MEKNELKAATEETAASLKSLRLNASQEMVSASPIYRGLPFIRNKPRRLVSLCLGVIGQYLEDVMEDLIQIASVFPSDIKMTLAAIARRRNLLNDDVLMALVDNSWELLDLSGSAATDSGLAKVAAMCKNLRAIDISQCNKITMSGVSDLVRQCHLLETLRCGGCPSSESTARRCINILKPKLINVEEESWEELDTMDISSGAPSLRWLIWPKIDDNSRDILAAECPRIVVNPQPSQLSIRGLQVPRAASLNAALDDPMIEDIDPKTWAFSVPAWRNHVRPVTDSTPELPIAERFRLAFEERDMRLAPKRAKNARQHQRRSEREWLMSSTVAKSVALATQASKRLHNKN